jgi:L-asparagine transporter-like permease
MPSTAYRPPRAFVMSMTCLAVLWATVTLLLLLGNDLTEVMHAHRMQPVQVFGWSVDTATLLAYLCCGFVWALLLVTLGDVETRLWIVVASVFTILLAIAALSDGVDGGVVLSTLFGPFAFASVRQLRLDRLRAARADIEGDRG